MNEISCFLGANSFEGFHSLYETYIAAIEPARVFVLKGGAGCGKSGFLRRIAAAAEQRGLQAERILCSGDPDSLDGVWIPDRGLAVFDGTAPHVLEPPQVGHQGFYLDLSRFYRPGVPPLRPLERAYREHYRRAYLYLSAAGSIADVCPLPESAEAAIRSRARSLALRLLKPKSREPGTLRRYYTDAFTCLGSVTLSDTRASLAPQRISLTGGPDAADAFLSEVLKIGQARGHSAVACPDPLDPRKLAHVLFPEIGLGFTVGAGSRKIHLEKMLNASDGEWSRARKESAGQQTALLQKAQKELQLAKLAHDRLEAAVHPYVDFDAVTALAEDFTAAELS